MTTVHALPPLPPEDELPHAATVLAALSLILVSHDGQEPDPPLSLALLTRLRDDVEAALLTGTELDRPREDVEASLLCLVATRSMVAQGLRPAGPPDLVAALSLPRLEASIRRTMDVLDAPAVLVLQPGPQA